MNINKQVTILVPTHTTKTCPSCTLITNVINGLEKFQELHQCTLNISYDGPTKLTGKHLEYMSALENIKAQFNITVMHSSGGQKNSFIKLIDSVKTKYLLFIEHDWKFNVKVPFEQIVSIMNKYNFIQYIGFNKRKNIRKLGDHILKPEDRVKEINLLKTSRWSNNPYIARTDSWLNMWKPIIANSNINMNKSHGQVERAPYLQYNDEIKMEGFNCAHKKWGIYIYGKMNDQPIVKHMDGNS